MSSLYERRLGYRSRLLSKPAIVLALRTIWVLVVIWCEFGVFFYSLSDCRWPDKVLQSVSSNSRDSPRWTDGVSFKTRSPSEVKPTRVLLVADARLQNPSISALNSWFGYGPNTAYLRKSWRAMSRLRPDAVVFLGDTFASSRYVTSEAECVFHLVDVSIGYWREILM